jgi:hypothetical protein
VYWLGLAHDVFDKADNDQRWLGKTPDLGLKLVSTGSG